MDQFQHHCAAYLALALLLATGCGPAKPAAVAGTSPSVVKVEQPGALQLEVVAPRPFIAAGQATPLLTESANESESLDNSTQAQFAQAANQPSPQGPSARAGASASRVSIYAPQAPLHELSVPVAQREGPMIAASTAGIGDANAQVMAMNERAMQMAQKGMLFAAKTELLSALALAAQGLDAQQGTSTHAAALAAGLTALTEADDFSPVAGSNSNGARVAEITKGHRTARLAAGRDVPAIVAQQQYLGFAQEQLAIALGDEPAAAKSLYLLGRIHTSLAGAASQTQSLHAPRAIVFHQAALAVDGRNHLAANELGVLLARYGQLADARLALQHSLSIQPEVETWHNLAIVHQRLGEVELARLAEKERQMLEQSIGARSQPDKLITWVDPKTFAASGTAEAVVSQPTAARSQLGSERR